MELPFRSLAPGQILPLTEPRTLDPSAHRWEQAEIDALTLAHAAQRPLLVRGEPGTGKTQLARAAAQHLRWLLLSETIHPRYEAQDLVFRFDAVRRLADAQCGQLKAENEYWEPGPLWRAYGWDSASGYGTCRDEKQPAGHVILIDEIDKADSDLPNSLLEVLGQRSFRIAPLRLTAGAPDAPRPLIVVTTNEERELPAAFVRRCVVLNLAPPAGMSYRDWLLQRGAAHFGPRADRPAALIAAEVMAAAADQLVDDREAAVRAGLAPPGPAEFLDLLFALHRLAPADLRAQRDWIDRLSAYAFVKHGLVEGQPRLAQSRPPLAARKP
jgi:MoxR-like ATPase